MDREACRRLVDAVVDWALEDFIRSPELQEAYAKWVRRTYEVPDGTEYDERDQT